MVSVEVSSLSNSSVSIRLAGSAFWTTRFSTFSGRKLNSSSHSKDFKMYTLDKQAKKFLKNPQKNLLDFLLPLFKVFSPNLWSSSPEAFILILFFTKTDLDLQQLVYQNIICHWFELVHSLCNEDFCLLTRVI